MLYFNHSGVIAAQWTVGMVMVSAARLALPRVVPSAQRLLWFGGSWQVDNNRGGFLNNRIVDSRHSPFNGGFGHGSLTFHSNLAGL